MEESPSNAVLLAKLEAMSDTVMSNFNSNKEDHLAIISQTTRTNGRVSDLEKWKNMTLGALVFTNVLVVPIILSLITRFLNAK